MKVVKSNFLALLQQKERERGRRISLARVAKEAGVNAYAVYGLANNTLKEYPGDVIAKLCEYFNCEVGDLLVLEDAPLTGS